MKSILLILLAATAFPASATLYLAAYDPATKAIGLIYSSSGGHFWQTKVKGKGLAGAQNYGLCEEATPQEFLAQGLSATEVANKIHEQCLAVKYYNYRFLVITADGQIDYVIGENGCSIPECGARRGQNVVVTGGGLERAYSTPRSKLMRASPRRFHSHADSTTHLNKFTLPAAKRKTLWAPPSPSTTRKTPICSM
jgi:hypothetical protein